MVKKKILFVVESMAGGVLTYLVSLLNGLVDNYDIYVAFATRKQTPSNYKKYFDDRIKFIRVTHLTREINLKKDILAFFELKKIAKDINPDIIHLHSSKAGALGRWAFNGRKTLLFYTPHGYSFLMSNCNKFKRFMYYIFEYISAKRYCTTISCSRGEHEVTLKLTNRALYINNGIDINMLQKELGNIQPTSTKVDVITIGRITYQKNPVLFNQIALSLPNLKFLWIGDGSLREVLTAPNIIITGWVSREEALKYVINGDVFILTSLWEGLPIALLEAMYFKKKCLVSNVIGNNDVIQDGVNGYICDNLNEFVEKIMKFHEMDSKLSDVITNQACKDVKTKYNVTRMLKQYMKIYSQSERG